MWHYKGEMAQYKTKMGCSKCIIDGRPTTIGGHGYLLVLVKLLSYIAKDAGMRVLGGLSFLPL